MAAKRPAASSRAAVAAPARPSAAALKARIDLRASVEAAAKRLIDGRTLRPGAIVFRDPAQEAPIFAFETTGRDARIAESAGSEPLLEISGDPRRLKAIIEGRKDAREQFFAGGISVRGDMRYLSELGMALGFLKTPIV